MNPKQFRHDYGCDHCFVNKKNLNWKKCLKYPMKACLHRIVVSVAVHQNHKATYGNAYLMSGRGFSIGTRF